jgi:uncharacterized protein (DUF1501 family)
LTPQYENPKCQITYGLVLKTSVQPEAKALNPHFAMEPIMTAHKKDPVLVVLQMSGAYDALNTVIPYSDPMYMEYRPVLKVEPEEVLALDDKVGFNPAMAPLKELYDEGKVAVLQGIGYPPTSAL